MEYGNVYCSAKADNEIVGQRGLQPAQSGIRALLHMHRFLDNSSLSWRIACTYLIRRLAANLSTLALVVGMGSQSTDRLTLQPIRGNERATISPRWLDEAVLEPFLREVCMLSHDHLESGS